MKVLRYFLKVKDLRMLYTIILSFIAMLSHLGVDSRMNSVALKPEVVTKTKVCLNI